MKFLSRLIKIYLLQKEMKNVPLSSLKNGQVCYQSCGNNMCGYVFLLSTKLNRKIPNPIPLK